MLHLAAWLVLLTAVFVPLERLFPLRPQRVLRTGLAVDLGYYFLNSLLPGLILGVPLAAVVTAVHAIEPTGFTATMASLPLWLRVPAAILVGEIGFYWGHRWSHQLPLLWRFHAIHHSAQQLDFLVNTRAHPVDMVFTRLCGLAPLYLLGLAAPTGQQASWLALLVLVVATLWGFFIHANLRWRLGPLEQLIATPAFHHWHHTHTDHRDRNYASLLPWLDRLFGTYHLPAQAWPSAYGTDTPVAAHLPGQLAQPLLPARRHSVAMGAQTRTG